jgi:hypothetical protein
MQEDLNYTSERLTDEMQRATELELQVVRHYGLLLPPMLAASF